MAPRRVQGFTLIELMVVAAIIGVSVVIFTPSFVFSINDRRAASAVSEVARLGRRARSEAIGTQRAHLVWIQIGGAVAGATGNVQLIMGTSAHCDVQNWATLQRDCSATPIGPACLETLDLHDTHWSHPPFQIRLRSVANAAQEAALPALIRGSENSSYLLCHEPSGALQWSVDPAPLDQLNTWSQLNVRQALGGGFVFAVGLFSTTANDVQGNPRMLAYPLGTTPRRLR